VGHRHMNTGVGGMYAPDGYITEAQLALSRSLIELVWDSGRGTTEHELIWRFYASLRLQTFPQG
jgi:hypothetical protein